MFLYRIMVLFVDCEFICDDKIGCVYTVEWMGAHKNYIVRGHSIGKTFEPSSEIINLKKIRILLRYNSRIFLFRLIRASRLIQRSKVQNETPRYQDLIDFSALPY